MMDGERVSRPVEGQAVERGVGAETDATARLARQIALTSQVGGEAIALLDADALLSEVAARVQHGMGYRRAAVILTADADSSSWAQSPPAALDDPPPWQQQVTRRVADLVEPMVFSAGDSHAAGVAVPLCVQDRVLGGLVVEFGDDAEWETTDLPFLTTVASLVAMAVENIRLFGMAMQQSHYLEQRAARLSRLLRASNHLQRVGPSQDALLRAVVRLAHESLDFRLVAVSLLEQDGRQLATRMLTAEDATGSQDVRAVQGNWERLVALLRPEFRVSRSYRIDRAQMEGAGDGADDPFHLPEVWPGGGPWRPHKALVIPFHEREGGVAGALTLDHPRDDRLPSQETVQAAEIFVNQVAVALDNARLFEELQRRLRETNTLFVMGREMVTTLDQDQVLESVAQAALKLVATAGKAAIHLVDESGYLVPRVVRPLRTDEPAPEGMKVGQGIAGVAAQQNRALYVSDVHQDGRFVGLASDFASLLVVPVGVGDRVIGTLSVDSPQIDAFGPDDERVLIILANQAAIALENARLYAEAKRVDELAALNRLTGRLSSTLDRPSLLQIAAEEAICILEVEAATVVRLSEDKARSAPYIAFGRRKKDGSVEVWELLPDGWSGHLQTELSTAGITVRRSLQAVMTARERVLGYVEVYNPLAETPTDEMMALLNSVAGAVGMALENARLYEEVRDSAEELAASQARLVQSAKLAATGRLAASIAHELNNPLQAVQSCVYLLSESVPADDPGRSYLDTAVEELERMARIVGRMVEFYRPAKASREPTDANRLLEGVLTLTRKRMQQSNVRLHTDLDSRLPKMMATADHVKQVFLNVVLNALDAMPHGGDLSVSSRLVVVPDTASLSLLDMQWAEFRFSDTGVGIEADVLPRIFDPFFTSKPKGTGLGLSVSYDIVERHGGTIEVESEPGKGATFVVRLPVRARPDGR
jgi:signal transduction histidine kinase